MVTEVKAPDEPSTSLSDPRQLAESYLDYCRDAVLRKIDGLSEVDLRTSRLPSGWAPLDLLVHLTWMERRWFRWDFAGDPMPRPWGDRTPDGRWQAPPGIPTAQLRAEYVAQCQVSRATVAAAALTDRAQPGGRFATTEEAPTLAWILFHVLYEYQRHAGHLDIARELTDAVIGE